MSFHNLGTLKLNNSGSILLPPDIKISVFKELEMGVGWGGYIDKRLSKVIGKINEFIYCYCINTQVF